MLRAFAWFTLVFNVVVILLGALVRATGSGAGCGASWPTCAGELIPTAASTATQIEFTHRASSGVALVAVISLAIMVLRSERKGDRLRKAAIWSVVAIVSEAAIGAAIVLFEWVADDASVARVVAVPLHLANTFVLLAALTTLAWWLSTPHTPTPPISSSLKWSAAGLILIGATGSVTALADTLFPATSLAEGLAQDLSGAESFLTQLRVIHPVVATLIGAFVAYLGFNRSRPGHQQRVGLVMAGVVVTQVFAGVANIVLLTPVWMQLVHLALADGLWILFVLYMISDDLDATKNHSMEPALSTDTL